MLNSTALSQACSTPLRELRTFLVRFPRCAPRSGEEPDPADQGGEVVGAGRLDERPSLLARMHDLHERGRDEDLYA